MYVCMYVLHTRSTQLDYVRAGHLDVDPSRGNGGSHDRAHNVNHHSRDVRQWQERDNSLLLGLGQDHAVQGVDHAPCLENDVVVAFGFVGHEQRHARRKDTTVQPFKRTSSFCVSQIQTACKENTEVCCRFHAALAHTNRHAGATNACAQTTPPPRSYLIMTALGFPVVPEV